MNEIHIFLWNVGFFSSHSHNVDKHPVFSFLVTKISNNSDEQEGITVINKLSERNHQRPKLPIRSYRESVFAFQRFVQNHFFWFLSFVKVSRIPSMIIVGVNDYGKFIFSRT